MLILEDFWNGNVSPGEGRYHTSKEYRAAWRVVESMEDKLKEQLTPENWELFNQYQDAVGKTDDIESTDIFIEGFRMGAKVILDVLLKAA